MPEEDSNTVIPISILKDQNVPEIPFPTLRGFDDQWKLKILFVKAGFAQAGNVILEPWTFHDPTVVPGMTRSAEAELKIMGLVVKSVQDEQANWHIWFSRSDDILIQIFAGQEHDEVWWGEMYGIPQTACEAYPNVIPDSELPKDITQDLLFAAIPFMPSRGNFRAEWKDFVHKATDIQRTMPQLVQQLDLQKLFGAI